MITHGKFEFVQISTKYILEQLNNRKTTNIGVLKLRIYIDMAEEVDWEAWKLGRTWLNFDPQNAANSNQLKFFSALYQRFSLAKEDEKELNENLKVRHKADLSFVASSPKPYLKDFRGIGEEFAFIYWIIVLDYNDVLLGHMDLVNIDKESLLLLTRLAIRFGRKRSLEALANQIATNLSKTDVLEALDCEFQSL